MWFSKPITLFNLGCVHVNIFFKGRRARHFFSMSMALSKHCTLSCAHHLLLNVQLVRESLQQWDDLLSHKLNIKNSLIFLKYKPRWTVSWQVEREDISHWWCIPYAYCPLWRISQSEHLHHSSPGAEWSKWHFCGFHRLPWTVWDYLLWSRGRPANRTMTRETLQFSTICRSEWAVLTISPPYISSWDQKGN